MTKNIKKILVPLDGSENSLRGLDAAISLAQKYQAEVTGVNVIQDFPAGHPDQPPYTTGVLKDAQNMMTDAKKRASENDVKFQDEILNVSDGSLGKEIVKFADYNNVDLIAIGSRGRGSIKEAFLGSVSHYISHKSNVPVLIVK